MKPIAIAIILAGTLGAGAASAGASCYTGPTGRVHASAKTNCGPVIKQVIHIDCFRGPWRETIWDQPQGSFVDDLVKYGYDYGDANGLATEICKKESLVGNPDAMRAELLRAIAADPPGPN
ncbi:hypothetical protein [Thioclava sp.]|uniref:hypothetical protein n=1 Tax=Thioclava sp. TaxID=1933450 RepID=UPI003AA96A1E